MACDSLSLDEWILFIIFLITLPLYIIVAMILIRYKKTDFSSPCFDLLISQSFCDIIHMVEHYLLNRIRFWGCQTEFFQITASWLSGSRSYVVHLTAVASFIGVTLIAINRCATMVSSSRFTWQKHHTKLAICVQWLLPGLYGLPIIKYGEYEVMKVNTSERTIQVYKNPAIAQIYFTMMIVWTVGAAVLNAVLYSICFHSALKQKRDIAPLGVRVARTPGQKYGLNLRANHAMPKYSIDARARNAIAKYSVELRLVFVGFWLSIQMTVYAITVSLIVILSKGQYYEWERLYDVNQHLFHLVQPYLLLILCTACREKFKMLTKNRLTCACQTG